MIIRLLVATAAGLLSFTAFASDYDDAALSAIGSDDLVTIADNRRKDRRDDRQDDRDDKQDCRQEEGRVGNDKRECKQDNRGEGDSDGEAEVEADA